MLKKFNLYSIFAFLFYWVSYSSLAIQPDFLSMEDMIDLSLDKLMEVKVTSATKSEHFLNTAPSTINSYNANDIRTIGVETLGDLLWIIAGVQVQENANNRHRSWFRGVQHEFNNKLVLYIDGVPIRGAFDGFSVDNEIPLESVKRIEVIRGPGSALYGANAFSGVISIFTYKAGERGYNLAKLTYGENNTRSAYLSANASFSEVKFSLEGKVWDTDGQAREFNRDGTSNTRPGEQTLDYLRGKISFLDGKLNFSAATSDFQNQRTDQGINRDSFREHESTRLNVDYTQHFNEQSSMNINAYYTHTDRLEKHRKAELFENGNLGSLLESYDFTDTLEVSGIHTTFDYAFSEHNKLLAGMEVKKEGIPDSYYIDKSTKTKGTLIQDAKFYHHESTDYGLFLQDSHTFANDRTTLTAGIRFDILDTFDNQFNYRLGLVHELNNEIFAKLLFGTAYRSPSALEYVRAPVDSPLPNAETVKTLEAQIGRQTKHSRYTLTAFRNEYKDFIARQNSFQDQAVRDLDTEIFGNIDDQTIYGLEFESRFKLSRHWQSFVNAAWLRADSDAADQEVPLLADWTLSAGLDWRKRVGVGEWLFHNHVVAYGDRQDWPSDVWEEGQQQRYVGRLDNFTDGFMVWNLGVHYLIKSGKAKGLDLGLTVKNVTDELYYTQSPVVPSATRPAYWDTQYDSRHIQLSVGYRW